MQQCFCMNTKVHAEHQMKTVEDATAILEQWAVLIKVNSGLYQIHDVHVHFVRANSAGEEWAGIHLKAKSRWSNHMSFLTVACEMDVYTLAGLLALKRVDCACARHDGNGSFGLLGSSSDSWASPLCFAAL